MRARSHLTVERIIREEVVRRDRTPVDGYPASVHLMPVEHAECAALHWHEGQLSSGGSAGCKPVSLKRFVQVRILPGPLLRDSLKQDTGL